MSTTEILLVAILVSVMALVAVSIMNVLSRHSWQTRSRLEKLKKLPERHGDLETLREEYKLTNSWKGHFKFFGNAMLYASISSFVLYQIIKFLNS